MDYLTWDEIQLHWSRMSVYVAVYLQVNILRAAINKLVCDGPNGCKCLGPERVAQLQDSARQKLLG